ncbi:MAG: HNH endonuclease [Pirellulaceae bacterium]|nr:HNH endonuclease [Pirellulaceae bacterium]
MRLHIEHIIARQHGGDDTISNLCLACHRCNAFKGTNLASLDSDTGQVVSLFHPRRQDWLDHFTLRDARIEGRTPTGRATVRLLHMNAARRVQLRAELIRKQEFELGL